MVSGRFLGFLNIAIVVALLASSVMPFGFVVYAQTSLTQDQINARQAALQAELDTILKEIDAQKAILSQKQQEGASISRDIAILDAQIAEAKLKIQAKQISIQQLGKDIDTKTHQINVLSGQADQAQASLADLLQKTQYLDDFNLPEIVLSNKNLSEFLQDLDSYYFIKQAVNQSLDAFKQAKTATEIARQSLDTKRAQEIDAKVSIEEEQRQIQKSEKEKQRLLSLSKKEQANYQSVIKNREAQAAAIRAALFALRDTSSIPFGQALDFANLASKKTGVRPAFILGILTQESDLGKNIGTCNRPGDPPSKSWTAVMKPSRDIEPFKRITAALGLDPNSMPVSCPIGNGWGGAMGPSQFIPSTWEAYVSRIQGATGGGYPNPWNPRDAIMATALYLEDLGAAKGGYTAERTAALKYYAGGNWNKPQNAFYGNQVMAKAQNIQDTMITPLQNI